MIGNPYAPPLPGSYGYPTKPQPAGMPTQYQDTPAKLFEGNGPDGYGGNKYPLPGDLPGGMPGAAPQPPPAPQPYGGMPDLDHLLQQRKANDQHRQMMAQLLAGQQPQQQQGATQYANRGGPVDLPPPIAEASPWSIVAAAFNGLADGYKRSRNQSGQQPNEEGSAWWGSDGGMKS